MTTLSERPDGERIKLRRRLRYLRSVMVGDGPCVDCPARLYCKATGAECKAFREYVEVGAWQQHDRTAELRLPDGTEVSQDGAVTTSAKARRSR